MGLGPLDFVFAPWAVTKIAYEMTLGKYFNAKDAADLQRSKADVYRSKVDEEVRRLDLSHERTISTTRATMGASGFEFNDNGTGSESFAKYLADMSSEFTRQVDWLKKAGYTEADLISKGADIQNEKASIDLSADLTNMVSRFYTMGKGA